MQTICLHKSDLGASAHLPSVPGPQKFMGPRWAEYSQLYLGFNSGYWLIKVHDQIKLPLGW